MGKFGLGQKVSLDMFEESPGLMPSREWKRATRRQPWFPGETLILGIGQGYMQATPLQLAQATALVASKGKWYRPHLAKTIEGQKPVDPNPVPDIIPTAAANNNFEATFRVDLAAKDVGLALADYFYQMWQHEKGLMMSKDEVKQESKNAEVASLRAHAASSHARKAACS